MTYDVALQRLRELARAARAITGDLPNGVPDLAAARVRLAEGLPALAGEQLIDWHGLVANVRALGGELGALGSRVGESEVVEAALAGAWDALGDDPDPRLITWLDYAVRPVLRAGYIATKQLIAEARWQRGICPACGALPSLAELRTPKEGEARTLRCGRCTAAWSYPRLACPACGEKDHAQLRYLHVDGEVDFRRAECCKACGFYVKGVARLDAIRDDELLEVDLETVGLDAMAIEAGYRPYA